MSTQVWEERWHPLREEWVIVAAHPEDRVVAGKVDLDRDIPLAHLGQQLLAAPFVGERHAMADAPRVTNRRVIALLSGFLQRLQVVSARIRRH